MGSKNLSIMFTDIKGFTERTSGATRSGMSDLLAAHDRLLVPVFHYFKGHIVKTIGDAFLVYFYSPTDAVLCGVTIQEVLRQHNEKVEEKDKLEVRVAINVGDVKVTSDDVLGEAVNIAARLEGVTEPGEVYFTEAVYQTMNRHEAPSSEIGERTFKGIPHPIRIYKVINDPGSNLAETLARGVKLSDKGPIIEGIRDQLVWRKVKLFRQISVAVVLMAIVVIFWLVLAPSAIEKARNKADKLLAVGKNLEVIALMDPLIAANPVNETLNARSLEAADGYIDTLVEDKRYEDALKWIDKIFLEKPYLHNITARKPMIDTKITMDQALIEGDQGLSQPGEIKKLLSRYPGNAEVPFAAGTMIEGKWWYMTVLWLYETALERGYQDGDRIYDFCIRLLSSGSVNRDKFEYAINVLEKHYSDKSLEWARAGLTSPKVLVTMNAMSILEKKKNPLLEDEYFDHLRNLVYGRNSNLEDDFDYFKKQTDPARRGQLLGLHKEIVETFPKFTCFSNVKDVLKANSAELRKEWDKQ